MTKWLRTTAKPPQSIFNQKTGRERSLKVSSPRLCLRIDSDLFALAFFDNGPKRVGSFFDVEQSVLLFSLVVLENLALLTRINFALKDLNQFAHRAIPVSLIVDS